MSIVLVHIHLDKERMWIKEPELKDNTTEQHIELIN